MVVSSQIVSFTAWGLMCVGRLASARVCPHKLINQAVVSAQIIDLLYFTRCMASTNLSSVAVNAKLDKINKIPKISYSYEQEHQSQSQYSACDMCDTIIPHCL